jgi:hypothetical protein
LILYLVSAEEKLVMRILSAGSAGIKKTDLRKELGDIDTVLEMAISKGDIFVDKRSGAYYCWHRSHYVQSLLNSDPRFKLTYDLIKSLENSVISSNNEVARAVETLGNNISNLARLVTEMKNEKSLQANASIEAAMPTDVARRTMSVYEFKREFDGALVNSASSIGWVELAKIRNELCSKCSLSIDEFYRLVEEMIGQNQDRYELSTGGGEGIMVRGVLHGFVRCI